MIGFDRVVWVFVVYILVIFFGFSIVIFVEG